MHEQVRDVPLVLLFDKLELRREFPLKRLYVDRAFVVAEIRVMAIPALPRHVRQRSLVRLDEAEPAAGLEEAMDLADGAADIRMHVVQAPGDGYAVVTAAVQARVEN
ncbi:MAG: hypothetical protein NTW86_09730 [Candidatus Sumerlaeota bacterium]|nr:hypothetical protein [Candidatus Sumerlaeota bacterium]